MARIALLAGTAALALFPAAPTVSHSERQISRAEARETVAARIPLAPTPEVVLRFCRDRAHRHKFLVLCPTRWPNVPSSLVTSSRRIVLGPSFYWGSFNDESGFGVGDDGHLVIGGQRPAFALERLARQVWPRPGRRQPIRLLLLPDHAPILRVVRVRNARALFLASPPSPAGGFMGGHVIVVWNRSGRGYFVSLHYDGRSGVSYTVQQRVAAALAIARSARPLPG
jgi:hypothetical protein